MRGGEPLERLKDIATPSLGLSTGTAAIFGVLNDFFGLLVIIASLVLVCLNIIIKVRVLRATKETRHAQDQ